MIKLQQILSEIKIQGSGYKKEIINWWIDKSPYLFFSVIEFINGTSTYNSIENIFDDFDFEEDLKEKMKQKVNELTLLLKPNEIYIYDIKESDYDTKLKLPNSYKFLRIIGNNDGDYNVILSNEDY